VSQWGWDGCLYVYRITLGNSHGLAVQDIERLWGLASEARELRYVFVGALVDESAITNFRIDWGGGEPQAWGAPQRERKEPPKILLLNWCLRAACRLLDAPAAELPARG
jgi:hypothetical protein